MEGSQPSSTSPYPTDGMRDDLYGEGLVPIRCLNEHARPEFPCGQDLCAIVGGNKSVRLCTAWQMDVKRMCM